MRARLHVELLEDRRVMYAADLLQVVYDPSHILVGDRAGMVEKIELQGGVSVAQALDQYQDNPLYAFAEPDYVVQAAVIPNDTNFGSLYGLHNTGQSAGTVDADIDAPEAWDVYTGSTAVTVGVIDTGIDYTHPDLYLNVWINQEEIPSAIRSVLTDIDGDGLITFRDLNNADNQGPGKISDYNANGRIDGGDLLNNSSAWEDGLDQDPYFVNGATVSRIDDLIGWNFVNNTNNPLDDNNHGTHVSGTIGAIGNNATGVTGVNWVTQIAALKFLSASGSGAISGATAALNYAIANGMQITNNSWGGGGFSQSFFNALSVANTAGQIFVAAAGNSGTNNDSIASYPSNYALPNVVAVAATDRIDRLASFSNYGATSVDLAAPGVSILSSVPSTSYSSFSGTSMATPHVAGAAALVWAAHPTWTSTQVMTSLFDTADVVNNLIGRVAFGRLNVNDAIRTVFGEPPPDISGPSVTAAVPNGTTSISSVRLTFSEAIDATTFNATDITNFSPGLINIGVSAVSSTQFDVTFDPVTTAGSYSFVVGPDIQDTAGNAMNQDNDGFNGESADIYTASFTISSILTFTNNSPLPIRDFTNTYSFINVPQNVSIADLNVRINITHTWDSDLLIQLRHPDLTTITLVNRRGGSGDNFSNTVLDDEAATAISLGAAPFAASYRPEQLLSIFDAKSALGSWRLRVYDAAGADIGTLLSWSLTITPGGGGSGFSISRDNDFRVRALMPAATELLLGIPTRFATGNHDSVSTADSPEIGQRQLRRVAQWQTEVSGSRPAVPDNSRLVVAAHNTDALFTELGISRTDADVARQLESLLGLARAVRGGRVRWQ